MVRRIMPVMCCARDRDSIADAEMKETAAAAAVETLWSVDCDASKTATWEIFEVSTNDMQLNTSRSGHWIYKGVVCWGSGLTHAHSSSRTETHRGIKCNRVYIAVLYFWRQLILLLRKSNPISLLFDIVSPHCAYSSITNMCFSFC